jgi:hypothetical protein
MSFGPTDFRAYARSGWGGRAANHFRGALSAPRQSDLGMLMEDPQVLGLNAYGQIGTLWYRSFAPSILSVLAGVSRDNAGAILGNCTVKVFRTADDVKVAETVSNATTGAWSVPMMPGGPFYYVEYKIGAPDRAGTSINTNVPQFL